MTKTKQSREQQPMTVFVNDPDRTKGERKKIGGSQSDDWNDMLFSQAGQTLWLKHADAATIDQQVNALVHAMIGIGPQDELEGMMAAQLLAAHNAAMECFRRAMNGEQTLEGQRENLNQANKLARTFATLLETLNRHRGKGQQKVTVEHVHVHPGGQAVVGVVEPQGGGAPQKPKEQPHAKRITHAPESSLRSPNACGDAVPIPGDAERPVPDARRKVSRRAAG
jgi:hypothetical protein